MSETPDQSSNSARVCPNLRVGSGVAEWPADLTRLARCLLTLAQLLELGEALLGEADRPHSVWPRLAQLQPPTSTSVANAWSAVYQILRPSSR